MSQLKIIFIVLIISIHAFLGLEAIKWLSPTYDEPLHLTSGYVYLKTGDYRINGLHHPPFAEMWSAIPLLVLNPFIPVHHPAWLDQNWFPSDQYGFADKFLYSNRVDSEKLMVWGRSSQLFLSILFCLALFVFMSKFSNFWGGLITAGFWALSPTAVAHATVVSTDLAFVVFFFLFFASMYFYPSWRGAFLGGLSLGLCFSSKYLAISIFPILLILIVWQVASTKRFVIDKNFIRFTGIILVVNFLALLFIYQFKSLEVFWLGFSRIVSRSQAGRASFLLGQHSVDGWVQYFPFVFLVKTPLPILIGLGLSIWLKIRYKIKIPIYLWIPPVLFFLLACFSKVQIGHRHILAIYPFIFLFIGIALSNLNWTKWVAGILLVWTLVNSIIVAPNFLAFFNEAAGGPQNGYKLLTDSNLDWGQGLKLLRKELTPEDINSGVHLNYFGVADPAAYGIKYLNVVSDTLVPHKDNSDDLKIHPTKFAISLTNLQGTYFANPQFFSWVKKYEPWKTIGFCMFVYDFKNNPEAIGMLDAIRNPRK